MTYELKDSGARKEFEGGMQRDTAEGKPHPNYFDWGLFVHSIEIERGWLPTLANDINNAYSHFDDDDYLCISMASDKLFEIAQIETSPRTVYDRINAHMELGAKKYSPNNWRKCVTDAKNVADRAVESMMRHAFQYYFVETDEDHLAATLYNVMLLNYCLKYGQTNTAE